ncbi:MAG: Spy/CpxP family protein refolding chaperone [Hyphomicrobiales bacterium]|nr:Spy/CpxP family protein refolding chaperone [Hyphomicrobiales bacterium]MCP4997528.1 Spy/CpxP family protein refolding chaperone [Hyphomicrobiales bacterium]
MSNDSNNANTGKTKKGNRLAIAMIAAVGITAGGIFAVQAIAQTNTYQHIRLLTADSGDGEVRKASWRGGWGRHGRGFSNLSDAEIESKIKRGVAHLAIEIDATDEQEEQIIAIVTPAVLKMKATRDQMRATGEEFAALLTAPVVDRAAVDALRIEKLAEVDQISKEWIDVVTDVAMVLTAEQRETISERMEQFRSMRGHWRH